MPPLTPIPYRRFESYLKSIGCCFARSEGDHNIWVKPGLRRPIVVRTLKDLPVFEIRNNLRTLGIKLEDFLMALESI